MNRVTYFSFAVIIAYFLPWINLTLFTISGFEIPSSIDKLMNFSEFLNDKKNDINITYFLYLIPISAIISIIGDFNKRNRNWILNEFVIGLVAISYIYYLMTEMNIEPRNIISIGFILTFIFSAIGLILVILKSPTTKENIIQNVDSERNNDKRDLFNQLEKLHKLNSDGIITNEIFEFEKKSLLEKIEKINQKIEIKIESSHTELNPEFNNSENEKTFFLKYKLLIITVILISLSFSIYYYYTNIKEPNSEINFDEVNKNAENVSSKDLQDLANKHFEKYKIKFETETSTNGTDTTYVGDFTNDGLLDVVLSYGLDSTEGNISAGSGLLLYKNNGNGIEFIKEYNPEFLFSVDKISNSKIILKKWEYKDDDARCCPSISTDVELNVAGENVTEKELK